MNMPKYRAFDTLTKKYVQGFLLEHMGLMTIKVKEEFIFTIDPSTLSINFPDMLDSNNKPIFASLSESGKGGDNTNKGVVTYKNNCFWVGRYNIAVESRIKIIGIQS